MAHEVTAPLVLVKDEAGAFQYLYRGAPLPSYVSAEDRKRLADAGLVADTSKSSK